MIGKVDCDNLRAEKEFSQLQYHNSKAANLLFTKELARREPDVLVCCVHPGTVRTDVFRHMPLPVKILVSTVFRVLTKSPAEAPSLSCFVPWMTLSRRGATTWTVLCMIIPCGSPSVCMMRSWPKNCGNQLRELLLLVGKDNKERFV